MYEGHRPKLDGYDEMNKVGMRKDPAIRGHKGFNCCWRCDHFQYSEFRNFSDIHRTTEWHRGHNSKKQTKHVAEVVFMNQLRKEFC